ncbi:replicative DNA helicase [uncultured Bacteroides sp.]|uniref:replicative DNA helicase n=2 Tax=Bacteroides TaxID=816 RepID=UPI00345DDF1E
MEKKDFKKKEMTGLELNLLHAEEVENAVLGAVMLEPVSLHEVEGFVREEMFYQQKHRYIWRAIESLSAKGLEPDIIMVTQELAAMGKLEEAGGAYEVTLKTANLASSAHLWEHVRVLYEFYLRRSIAECMMRRLGEVTDRTQDVYEVLLGLMADLEKLEENSPLEEHLLDMKGVMKKTCGRIRERVGRSVNGVTGIPTGVPELDRITGGWQPGNLIFTAGRPGMGKTQLGLKFALHAAEKGYKVLFYTLEMMSEEVGERVLMMRAPELYRKVKGGYTTEQEVDDLCRVGDEVAECRMMVDDTPYVSIDRLCAGAQTVKSRWGLDLVVVDYLQLLGTVARTGRTREQEVAECSRRLKALARSLECPVIVASQLNRQVEQTFDHRPELKHLRESGAIEQDADLVIMLHRNERGGDPKRCGLIVAKNRHGEASQPNTSVEVDLF